MLQTNFFHTAAPVSAQEHGRKWTEGHEFKAAKVNDEWQVD